MPESSPPVAAAAARGVVFARTPDVVRMLTRILKSANMRHTIIHLEVLRVDITKFQLRASHEPKVF